MGEGSDRPMSLATAAAPACGAARWAAAVTGGLASTRLMLHLLAGRREETAGDQQTEHPAQFLPSAGAGALLTLVMKLQQGGATVEFRNINPLVGALFQLLGITAVSSVHLRRP